MPTASLNISVREKLFVTRLPAPGRQARHELLWAIRGRWGQAP